MTGQPQEIAHSLPFARLLGLEIIKAEPDLVEARLRVREDLCTIGGILHGGALMSFADTLGAMATFLNLPDGAKGTTTIESKTNFFGAAPVGSDVLASTTPLHRGRSTQVWQTHLSLGSSGKAVGMVTQTQLILR